MIFLADKRTFQSRLFREIATKVDNWITLEQMKELDFFMIQHQVMIVSDLIPRNSIRFRNNRWSQQISNMLFRHLDGFLFFWIMKWWARFLNRRKIKETIPDSDTCHRKTTFLNFEAINSPLDGSWIITKKVTFITSRLFCFPRP